MNIKSIIIFIVAVGISFFGAAHRFGDSAHSIGLISAKGGKARHPSYLESGKDRYMLISTATVIPPYRGDARVVLEGSPAIDYELHDSGPAVDLGMRRLPKFRDNTYSSLRPGDRLSLWVKLTPPILDPVCRMAFEKGFLKANHEGRPFYFCSEECRDTFMTAPDIFEGRENVTGKYTLAFYDTRTAHAVLRVPIIFKGKGEQTDAGGHHH